MNMESPPAVYMVLDGTSPLVLKLVLDIHVFYLTLMCVQVYDCGFPYSLCSAPFWGRYDGYWEDSLMMVPVMYRNMLDNDEHILCM